MEKISLNEFKNDRGLIIATILLAFLVTVAALTIEIERLCPAGAIIGTLVSWLITAWWFTAFWNKILTKIFKLREISYGVAFLLIGAAVLIL